MNSLQYLVFRRIVVLIDEYFYYFLLFLTYFHYQDMLVFGIVAIVGAPMVYAGYHHLERLENAIELYKIDTHYHYRQQKINNNDSITCSSMSNDK